MYLKSNIIKLYSNQLETPTWDKLCDSILLYLDLDWPGVKNGPHWQWSKVVDGCDRFCCKSKALTHWRFEHRWTDMANKSGLSGLICRLAICHITLSLSVRLVPSPIFKSGCGDWLTNVSLGFEFGRPSARSSNIRVTGHEIPFHVRCSQSAISIHSTTFDHPPTHARTVRWLITRSGKSRRFEEEIY